MKRGGALDIVSSRDILNPLTVSSWLRSASPLRNINIDPGKATLEVGSDISSYGSLADLDISLCGLSPRP